MSSSLTEFTPEEEAALKRLEQAVASHRALLLERMGKLFLDLAYENKYTLHPRQIGDRCEEEVDGFLEFFRTPDLGRAAARGRSCQEMGVGVETCLATRLLLRDFVVGMCRGEPEEKCLLLQKAVDLYLNSHIRGFIESVSQETLKNQEQIRQALSAALENQRRELLIKNHAIDTSINGIVLTELDGTISYVNAAFLSMWDYQDESEILGKPMDVFLGDKAKDLLQSITAQKGWKGEACGTHKGGSVLRLEISASTIRDARSHPVGVMVTFVDVTERRHLEAQFRQAQKMDALGQLAGGIVHDFNNLLTAVSGFTQLALMDVPKEGRQYQDFMQIKIATDRGKGLTDQLRFFTREATGERTPLDMNKIIDETSLLLKRTFPKEVSITQNLQEDLWTISADASQMSQLLMNLCVNARDALVNTGADRTEESSLTLGSRNVELDAYQAARFIDAQAGRYICISVTDNGIGMSSEVIDRLFEPFFTTKEENGGTGLGLAVVYGIVQNHGGFLDVRSRLQRGSTFEVYLPVVEAEESKKAPPPPARELVRGEGTILVVEDEPQVRQMAVRTLQRCGYEVLTAENGIQAVSLFKANRRIVDLVILDMVMPKMGGRESFRRLKEIDPNVKVLCITGYTADGSYGDLLSQGVIGVLEKPLDLYEFAEATKRAVSREE